jgi:hypothetical protein
MVPTGDFVDAFSQFTRESGRWRNTDPDSLVAQWADFVENCEKGYPGEAEDYFNDLTARDALERALVEPSLAAFAEMAALRRKVYLIDQRLRAVLRPHVFEKFSEKEWWNAGFVYRAGPRLVEDMRQSYGIDIEVVR